MLVQMAVDAGLAADDALATGSEQGRLDAGTVAPALACLDALVVDLSTLGFDPAAVREPASATVGFMHCPFRDLAEISPAIVCGLHQGMVEGFVEARGGAQVREFRTLVHRSHPCQVDLADLDLAPAP
jgi:predicted ArsR family transcriptional regulator